MTRPMLWLLLALLLTACNAQATSADPNILAGQAGGALTSTAEAQVNAAQATQGAQQAVSVDATAFKVGLLVQAEADDATRQAGLADTVATQAVTSTLEVLAARTYAEIGIAQAMLRQANADAQDEQAHANLQTDFGFWLVTLLVVFGMIVNAILGGHGVVWVQRFKRRQAVLLQIWQSREWDKYEMEKSQYQLAAPGRAVTLAQRHLQDWEQANHALAWRAGAKRYMQLAVEVGQQEAGNLAFSEATALRYELVVKADSGKVWLEGYREIVRMLQAVPILTTPGRGGRVEFMGGWDYDRFAREFDTTALPYIPTQAPPGLRLSLSEVVEL